MEIDRERFLRCRAGSRGQDAEDRRHDTTVPFSLAFRAAAAIRSCPRPDFGKGQQLFAHIAAGVSQRRRRQASGKQSIGSHNFGPVFLSRRATHRGDKNAFTRRQGMIEPTGEPAFEADRVADGSLVNGRFESPGMTISADRQCGVAELKEAEVHAIPL